MFINYPHLHAWRLKYIPGNTYFLVLSSIVGTLAGSAAVFLKTSVHYLQKFLTTGFDIKFENYFYLIYPLIGIFITGMIVKFFIKTHLGHGITDVIYTISKKSSRIEKTNLWSRMFTSFFTVGFGGSVGLEAPVVVTGSAIGSNLASFIHLDYKKRTLLLSCGTAGAIAGIFNTPIAGVLFALEVILLEFSIISFIPLLIASASGAIISQILIGADVMFHFELRDKFHFSDLPFFIGLGFITGLVSVYFARTSFMTEKLIKKISNGYVKALTGGVFLGIIIFIFPPIYGEGYSVIKTLLSEHPESLLHNSLFYSYLNNSTSIIFFILGILLIKPAASSMTIACGGSGGLFAPSLFVGSLTGFFFAYIINHSGFNFQLSESNFTLTGMCGLMSGVLYAPLTGIFLIAEITGGYELFIPLMVVSAISFMTYKYFEHHSMYTKQLEQSGEVILYNKDKQLLSQIDTYKLIEKDVKTIHETATVDELTKIIAISQRNIFPVLDTDKFLKGIILLDDIREIMFNEEIRKKMKVVELMHEPPAVIYPNESMDTVMAKFENTQSWNLPVVENGIYIGMISKSSIFSSYRSKLIRQNKEF